MESYITIRTKIQFLLLFCVLAMTTQAQDPIKSPLLNIGDPAPPIRVQSWIKGPPVQRFERGKVYVVDFWATWCRPCIASMPHLSDLAHQYKDQVTFLAIDVWEDKVESPASLKRIRSFIDSMGKKMNFTVAVDDSNFMAHHWIEASGQNSIPSDFVVNAQSKIVWIGNPVNLDTILPRVLNKTWDIRNAKEKRDFNQYLQKLDLELGDKMQKYLGKGDLLEPDSALLIIHEMVKKEPKLKYAPITVLFTFWALLITNKDEEAYQFGKKAIRTVTYQAPATYYIIAKVKQFQHELEKPKEMYRLAAEAYQSEIDYTNPIYRKLLDLPKIYNKMATWYRLAEDTLKAKEAENKAIKWKDGVKQ